jgi:hypothetical protein
MGFEVGLDSDGAAVQPSRSSGRLGGEGIKVIQ